MRRFIASLIFSALLVPTSAATLQPNLSLPAWRPGPRGDLAFYTSPFLATTAYRKPDSTASDFAADGAYGPLNRAWDATHSGRWLIEEQRYASDAIMAGLIAHRQDLIDRGRHIFDWGFSMEQPDGSFDCPDRFHSASLFIEAASHSALLLQASDVAAANQNWVGSVTPKLNLAAHWMIDPRNEGPGRAHDEPYTHRFYLDAAAIGEAGELTHDDTLIKRSRDYVRDGIAHQQPDGADPEKGGTDTSYHVVGLLFAMNYYSLVANDGNLKTMSYGSAYRAYFYWAVITHNGQLARTAALLYNGQQVEKA